MIDVGGPKLFACDECPIVEQLDRRLTLAQERPELGEFQYDYCSCDKVDGGFDMCGYCEDAWAGNSVCNNKNRAGERGTGRAYRCEMRKKHLQKYLDRHAYARCCVVPYPNWARVDGEYVMVGTHIVYPRNSNNKTFYKRLSNKKIRRARETPARGGGYRKVFDYWWTLY